jgi:uncharacterized protein (DUF924 family)
METAPEDALSFWFGEPAADAASMGVKFKRWFVGRADFDREIRDRFGDTVERALSGALDPWAQSVRGRLALIVLLDQFTRNVFRDDARAFSGDHHAQRLAVEALDTGLDSGLEPIERFFLITPLGHAEDLALQERSVAEGERLFNEVSDWQRPFFAKGAEQRRKHRDVIARFGRFPHRNAVLGRASSVEEEAFLDHRRRDATA